MPIGFDLDDEDEADCEPEPVVGDGCASLTVADDSGVETIREAARAMLRLRRAGATFVKIGEMEAQFGPVRKR